MVEEYRNFLKQSLDLKSAREERYRDLSRDKLFKAAKKRIQTTMIGSLSTLEGSFGFLWGLDILEEDRTPEQKRVYEIYEEARAQILDRGNTQIRNLEAEFVNYDIVRKKHYITLPVQTGDNQADKKEDKKDRIIDGLDNDGKTIKTLLRQPTAQDYRDSQVQYNETFRKALDSGALLRQKLTDYMEEQGIWDEAKQKENDDFIKNISGKEEALKGGGIRLSDAKNIALELRELRENFRTLLSERNTLDANSAEGQADNARFSELIRLCILDPTTKTTRFPDQKAYDAQAEEPWVIGAAAELAGMIYGLDPNYDKNLEENKFLKEFKFVDEKLRFVNDEGHLVDMDGRLINEDSRFIAYRTKEGKKNKDQDQLYFVNRDGEEVVLITNDEDEEEWVKLSLKERKPFLDDSDNPIESSAKSSEDTDKTEEVVASEEKPTGTRKRKTTKTTN